MVRDENSSQRAEDDGQPAESLLGWHDIMWAAQQPVLNGTNSYAICHTLFPISQPTSGQSHGLSGLPPLSQRPICPSLAVTDHQTRSNLLHGPGDHEKNKHTLLDLAELVLKEETRTQRKEPGA